MDNLVFCTCGHALDRHASRGCVGDRETACSCLRTSYEALDAAVEAARSEKIMPETSLPFTA